MHSVTLGVSSLVLTVSMFINLTTMMWFTYKNIKYLEAQLSDCRASPTSEISGKAAS